MSATVLIVDDEENARHNIRKFLTGIGYEILEAKTLAEAREIIQQNMADIILLDVELPDGFGPVLLEETAHLITRPPIIMITAYGEVGMAVNAMKNGAHDFLEKPIRLDQLEQTVQRAEEIVTMRRELAHMRRSRQDELDFVIGKSPVMQLLIEHAEKAAMASVSVLITGETGTGKEILANAIHRLGTRKNQPFIALNSAAIQPTVLESELFGYEAGAFTGAEKRKHGLMEVADGGILFLDEISAMPVDIQAKLLRAIEERSFRRVGGTTLLHVDVQVIAASNRNLLTLIEESKFREDLYYRLKVVDLHLPPLRERRQDIPELVGLFILRNNMRMGKNITNITPRAMEALIHHSWPGNIRELRNVIERAVLFCDESAIDISHLPRDITDYSK